MQTHVALERCLRTANPNRATDLTASMTNPRHDSELEVQNLLQLCRDCLNQKRSCELHPPLRVGANEGWSSGRGECCPMSACENVPTTGAMLDVFGATVGGPKLSLVENLMRLLRTNQYVL